MSKPKTITNREARTFVEQGVEFINTNKTLWGEWRQYGPYHPDNVPAERCYCVFSYSYSWPLLVYSDQTDTWYSNDEKYSRTTSRHMSHVKPREKEILSVGCRALVELMSNGAVGHVRKIVAEA